MCVVLANVLVQAETVFFFVLGNTINVLVYIRDSMLCASYANVMVSWLVCRSYSGLVRHSTLSSVNILPY
jgi:hypothetical protein